MSLNDVDMTTWTNWAANLSVTPVAHCWPKNLADVVGFVQLAEQQGKHVHAVGSSWSFTDIAMTPDYLVETSSLNHVLTTVNPAALNNAASGRKLLHVEAGIKLSDLMAILDAKTWAVPTLGGADGQTLAGALSTSVHGADFDRGPLPEMVRAIHLVGPGGTQHWIEPTQGITDPARLQQALLRRASTPRTSITMTPGSIPCWCRSAAWASSTRSSSRSKTSTIWWKRARTIPGRRCGRYSITGDRLFLLIAACKLR